MPGLVRPIADEREGLLAFLAQQRYVLRVAAYGLSDEQARQTPTVSSLCIGGLIKHVAATERNWIDLVQQRSGGNEDDYVTGFRMGPDETLAGILQTYDEVAAETERVIAGIADLGQAVPVPKDVPWFPSDVDAWSVRWVLLHVIEETARHAGHADIIRESIDGATALPLLAAVEGWPATPWLQPWQPE
ncbi:MAG TPA: DinB family protein [Chloroflexota bacterium]|nr:DinB family protein [Chloroflexota bacterium]